MKILVVEDQNEKLEVLLDFLASFQDGDSHDIARSYHEATASLRSETYDLVILDMSIPIYKAEDGLPGTMLVYGGEELLSWAKLRRPKLKVAVLTQFDFFNSDGNSRSLDDIRESFGSQFGQMVLAVIHYQETETRWQGDLFDVLAAIRTG